MKNFLVGLFSFIVIGHFACQAQKISNHSKCKQEYDSLLRKNIYTRVDQTPRYATGELGVLKFFRENFRYPEGEDFYQASFNLVFVVTENGVIEGARIYNRSVHELTAVDKEALRVLSIMPKWEAGKCKDIKVPVRVSLPIRF